jgi:hypothetical protein
MLALIITLEIFVTDCMQILHNGISLEVNYMRATTCNYMHDMDE